MGPTQAFQIVGHCGCNDDWTGSDQFFAPGIHLQIQSFQCPSTEKLQIPLLRKHDFIYRLSLVHFENRIAYRAGDDQAIGHLKLKVLFARLDANPIVHTENPIGLVIVELTRIVI